MDQSWHPVEDQPPPSAPHSLSVSLSSFTISIPQPSLAFVDSYLSCPEILLDPSKSSNDGDLWGSVTSVLLTFKCWDPQHFQFGANLLFVSMSLPILDTSYKWIEYT